MTRLNTSATQFITALLLASLPVALQAADTAATENRKASAAKTITEQVHEATESGNLAKKRLSLVVNGKTNPPSASDKTISPGAPLSVTTQKFISEKIIDLDAAVRAAPPAKRTPSHPKPARPRPVPVAKVPTTKLPVTAQHETPATESPPPHAQEEHWSYAGDTGPQAWSRLNKDFNVCAIGKRQSPINIEENYTLQGPAEPLQFSYQPSSGTVVNNGHTIQVDLTGENTLLVRGSRYRLVQFHFHTPSEEQVNGRGFAMVAHLVHKNEADQLAVVAVLLEAGAANSLIHQVWTYMPLDSGDRVSLPTGLIDMNALLPKDQRYYQFMGSLTTPPCTEGVLWMVLKQPTPISKEQIKLFTQLFPNNARPVQAVNGRSVRDAQ